MAHNLLDKIWSRHEIKQREDGTSLLFIDRHFVHEGSHHAFNQLRERSLGVSRPDLTFGVADHYVPTRFPKSEDESVQAMIDKLEVNCQKHGVKLFPQGHRSQGIVHVIGPQLGLSLPGLIIVCGDSHTATHGALGSFAFGIGASEVAHVLATQTLWQKKPKSMNIQVIGALSPYLSAKDVILSIIAQVGSDGAIGHAIEYSGSVIEELSIEGRLTLCNMSIEAGARSGFVSPDAKVVNYLKGREYAPKRDVLEAEISALRSDEGARYDQQITLNGSDIAPTLTWGITPEQALPITGFVPVLGNKEALDYMGFKGGERLEDVTIDRVFIGSCTNSRIEDLRIAASLLNGRTAKVGGLVSAGSTQIKAQAESEGLDRVFINAGLEWVNSGCSMCVGMNGDIANPYERVASSTNRNFKGRQGEKVRTHLMSPLMVAAAAITGKLADFRKILP